uniref:Glycosyltransferase n=1 Tax=Pithovirus LCPAC404 TaxID=2506597 RepID=A0A481ZCN3_9VIRU|nr:MAG: glycosyltransferase [Pithovirus LCPAC404]
MEYIPEMIKHLEDQSLVPDCIYFNLPYRSIKEDKPYPKFKLPKTSLNVIVNRCEDHGPLTKILPTLDREKDPNTLILTLDDDVVYQDYVIEKLVKAIADTDKTVYSFSGWNYMDCPLIYPRKGTDMIPFYCWSGVENFVHGISGAIYRRSFFGDDFHNLEECWTCDDILLSKYLSLHGIMMVKINELWYKRQISNEICLFSVNSKELPYSKCVRSCDKEWPRKDNIDTVCYLNAETDK